MMKRQRSTWVGHAGTVHYVFSVCSGHLYDVVLQSAVPRIIYVRCMEIVCPVIYTKVPRRLRNPAERLLKWFLPYVRLVCRFVWKLGTPREPLAVFI